MDFEGYLQSLRDQIKDEIGLMQGSKERIAFDKYLAQLENQKMNTMAGVILQNI